MNPIAAYDIHVHVSPTIFIHFHAALELPVLIYTNENGPHDSLIKRG